MKKKDNFLAPEEEKLKVIIGDHIKWEMEVAYYKSYADYYTFLHDLTKALLMGNDVVASAEVNRVCDAYPIREIGEELRTEYLRKASLLKPMEWAGFLPDISNNI